jgi:hypothetical protein
MPALPNARHEAFAQALARSSSIAAAYAEAGYKPNRGNAHTLLKQNKCISKRVEEIQAEQLAIHQQATAEAAANAKVTLESLIAEAEAARIKAMSERRCGCCKRSDSDRRFLLRRRRLNQHDSEEGESEPCEHAARHLFTPCARIAAFAGTTGTRASFWLP